MDEVKTKLEPCIYTGPVPDGLNLKTQDLCLQAPAHSEIYRTCRNAGFDVPVSC